MPALYPENTQYTPPAPAYNPKAGSIKKTTPAPKVSPAASVSQSISAYRASPAAVKPATTVPTPTFSGADMSNLVANLQKSIADRMAGTQAAPDTGGLAYLSTPQGPSPEELVKGSASFPFNKPIASAEDKYAALPAGYETWKTDEQGRWVSPSEKAQIVTMPENVGGGQYINDPSQPGKLIKSNRGYDQRADNIMRGGLYSKDVQIDHIIPLWAGGADTVENRQLLRTDEHAKKTKIQAVPLTLLSAGLISINEARVMAANTQSIEDNYDISKIPTPYAKTDPATGETVGMLDLDTAKKLADEWAKPPPVTFKDVLKAVPAATEKVGKTILPPMAWGALKGFANNMSMGIIPLSETKYNPEEASFLGIKRTPGQQKWDETSAALGEKVGGMLGYVASFMTASGAAKMAAGKLGLKALTTSAKKPIVSSLSKLGAAEALGAGEVVAKPGVMGAIKNIFSATPMGMGAEIGKEVAGTTIAAGKDVAKLAAMAAGKEVTEEAVKGVAKAVIGKEAGALTKMAAEKGYTLKNLPWAGGAKVPVQVIDTTKRVLLDHILKNVGGQVAYGQLRTEIPVLMGYEKDPGFDGRMKQLVFDAAYGGLLGNASQTLKGYSRIGSTALVLGLIEGSSPEDAFGNAVSLMALHGLGASRGKNGKPLIDKAQLEKDLDIEASKVVTEWRSRWLPEQYGEYVKRGETLPQHLATPERMAMEDKVIMGKIDRLVAEGRWSTEQAAEAKAQMVASSNQLKKGGLADPIRKASDVKDIMSFAEQMKKREQGSSYTAPDELIRMGENIPDELLFSREPAPALDPSSKMPNMRMQVTGVAKDIDPITSANQVRFKEALDNGNASNKVFLVRRDSLEPVVRGINAAYTPDEIANLMHKPSENPWNNVEVWGLVKNANGQKEFMSLGWVPRKFRIDEGKYSINNRIDEINKQYQMTIPRFDPLHNKDLTANTMRGMDADIATAYVTKAGIGKESGEPFMEIATTDSNWNDANLLKQYYKAGNKESTMTSLLSKAKNSPAEVENAAAVVEAMAEKRPVNPQSVLKMSNIPEGPSKEAVNSTTKFFAKSLESDSPDKLMADINGKFGEIVSPEMAQTLIANKRDLTVDDIGNILYTGIKEGKATPETELFYKELFVPFFKDTSYQSDNISSFFRSVPIMGRTPAERLTSLQAEGRMPIVVSEQKPAVISKAKDGRVAVFEERFTPENRLKDVNDPMAKDLLNDPALKDPNLREKIIRLGWKDELTNLLNARYYHQSGMANKPQVFLDLDKFHDINGKYGYEGGDAVIKSLSDKMNKYFPNRGIRRGGEEFILDVDGLPREEVVSRLDKIAGELKSEKFKAGKDAVTVRPGSEFGEITFTSSFGKDGPEAANKTLAQKEIKRGVIDIDEEAYTKSIKPSEAYEQTPEGVRGSEKIPSRIGVETAKVVGERRATSPTEGPQNKSEVITTKSGQELKKEAAPAGKFWLEQNVHKEGSKWAKLAKSGHKIEHLMDESGFAGKVKIDGKEYTYDQADKKFLKPNKIFESAAVAKEAPEVVVTPEVKKDVLKSLVTGERRGPKVQRAESIYKDIYSTGEDRLGEIDSNDRRKYASKIMNTLNSVDIEISNKGLPKSAYIEKREYSKIRQAAVDNLKSKALDDLETKFDVDQEIAFKRGGSLPEGGSTLADERQLIRIDNKKLLDIPLDDAEKEFLKEHYKSLPEGERPPAGIGSAPKEKKPESPIERQKRLKESFDLFGNVFKKTGKSTLGDVNISNTKDFKSTLESNIKTEPKNTYSYGFSRAFNDFMEHTFGKDYEKNWGLNAYFGTGTKRGQSFWDQLYKTMNENRHPISQPKEVVERLVKKLKEKPYDEFNADDKEYIYGKRRKQAAEIASEPKREALKSSDFTGLMEKEAVELDMAIKRIEQSEGANVTDLTKLDELSAGRIGAELGILPDASAGSRDARAFIIKLISEYNSNVRHDNATYKPKVPKKTVQFNQKAMDEIENRIASEMKSGTKSLRQARTVNLNERYSNVKRSVDSMERLRKAGELREADVATLERNRRILSSLEKAGAK